MASVGNHYGGPEPYSTLEVQGVESWNIHGLHDSNKEAVPHPESQYPQPVSTLNAWDNAPKPEASGVDAEATVAREEYNDGNAKKRRCGLSPSTFKIVLAVVILIIIAVIAGGVAGGLSSRSRSSGSPSSGEDPAENVNVLSTSKLTASNFTDARGNVHRHVFFQDPHSSLISRQWDSENRTWTTRNLSRLMAPSTHGAIRPLPGTALACAAADSRWGSLYEVHVWFSEASADQDPDPTVSWLNANDPVGNPDYWTFSPSVLRTWNRTQLAVAWQRCPADNCVGDWILAYQGREGYIRITNASNWDNNTEPVVSASAVSGTASLALLPSLMGTYVHGLTLASQRRPSSIGKTTFIGDWNWKEDDGTILNDVDPLTTRQFAATAMNNWTEALFVALSTDGGVKGARWDGRTAYDAIPRIDFADGEATNFSAIAMTTDATFYGIADDQVWEYAVDTADPSTFRLAGRVYP
ncbi:uncharacterized protein F4812DRAFT_461471 [Daldinia caldariorum]|uniref:uncharacterized protein n=1 Tax=Daldinia caldariorum TaxID=326644 RepID=UPI002008396A|nr:uncharacterized protein F4812DRAFT_461471 [Daldinia caldariorum]KAI1465783.1 hypothetical protein F4812DRAFT_461471 [Daldinia caldariorum]